MPFAIDPARGLAAAAVLAAYAGLCAGVWWRERRRQAARRGSGGAGAGLLVAYASQTGFAEELAGEALAVFTAAGIAAEICPLDAVDRQRLLRSRQVLFIVATAGEGDPPDNALQFARSLLGQRLPLGDLHYGLLALGDSDYRQFCGFGRLLGRWLEAGGATPLFAPIEVDRAAPAALAGWRQQLAHLAGTADVPDWQAPAFADWQLLARRQLNPGSTGAPLFHLEFAPAGGQPLPDWQAGDLAQVLAPGDPSRPRDYSLASIPADGRVHLLVRLQRDADGRSGVASGWLCEQLAPGQCAALRLRPHRNFRLGDNAGRPLILIGSGSGMAGLRAHLRARAAAGDGRNWLIFGERNAATDFLYRDEIAAWQQADLIVRADFAFSRDQPEKAYVQDCLLRAADSLRDWVAGGAAIYVCGSARGMGAAVDAAMTAIFGAEQRAVLLGEGRYRRDIY